MSSFNQRECVECGQPYDGFYCYLCMCQQCGIHLINGICLNCTYGDGKPVTCCGCEGPIWGGFCSFCASRAEYSLAYDPNPNSFDDSQNLSDYPPQPQIYQWSHHAFYDDDDDEYSIQVSEFLKKSPIAITPVLPTKEPDNSLCMGDEHLSTILETKLDEVIKSSVENLVPILSESEGILDNMCDVPFSDKNHFDAESDLIESLLTRDILIVYSSNIDSLLGEFAGELIHIDSIPLGINETDSDPKDDIRFIE
nr:hypothetical protein [Tanacetum cinerariifolium]